MTNRVAVTKPVTVRSVNGPEVTVIRGYQVPITINGAGAIRCMFLTSGATLIGFTLTNGATLSAEVQGGGVFSVGGVLSDCVLTGNSAWANGGGAAYGTLSTACLRVTRQGSPPAGRLGEHSKATLGIAPSAATGQPTGVEPTRAH